MKRFSLTHFATAAMVVSAGLMVAAALTPRSAQAGNNGKGGGGGNGGGGNETTPATITFCNNAVDPACNPSGHELLGNGGPYVDGVSPDLEVFIGSAANDGNIRLKGRNSVRMIEINVPANDCELPTGPQTFDFQSLKVDAAAVISGGVHSIGSGVTEAAPMTIRFAHNTELYFLSFDPGKSGICKNKSGGLVQVTGVSATSWTVTNGGSTACIEKHESKGKNTLCDDFVAMDFSFDVVEQQ